ncbi:dGTPase [Methanohalophilus levihalophilus]|uniref:deoxyguanosinetriphosphate triphosphohydrolase family protein n=1 Tax=Methanohalophilus levihalophilus TaxID=1431282 RepID=UPI001AE7E331|nr:HD domain-containing protein [Methanohalophilus levihalophilus]MBP2030862.1 dGTPase [Methanohalophilus levihalophilus]
MYSKGDFVEIQSDIMSQIELNSRNREQMYSEYATKNSEYVRRYGGKKEEPFLRPPFFRDADRIIHSKAFSRYIDKTQVFFLMDNDHITHRVIHVQLVSKIARVIGRALCLNEDLIEAIALGHDIGHVPYGHLGEKILDKLCRENEIGPFKHNIQSIQFLDQIEDCNLTLQTLDGILCHDGESHNQSLKPTGQLDWGSFENKLKDIQNDKNVFPLTLEGCLVRISDTIAYLGRDLQDAIEVDLITEKELINLPENCKNLFGYEYGKNINWLILDTLIRDVINNSSDGDHISFSSEVSQCVKEFKDFNYENIYYHPKLKEQVPKIEYMYSYLFDHFLNDIEKENKKSLVYEHMINLDWISKAYLANAQPAEIVRDYLAGMTDRYFEYVFTNATIPSRDKLKYRGR